MAKKRKSTPRDAKPKPQEEKPIFVSPFKDLKKMLAERAPVKSAPSPAKKTTVSPNSKASSPKREESPGDEAELLRKAFVHWAARGPSGSPSTRPLARILLARTPRCWPSCRTSSRGRGRSS